MKISKRLFFLQAVPLAILLALGIATAWQVRRIQTRVRFVVESRVPALSALNEIARLSGETRVRLRDFLLAPDSAGHVRDQHLFDAAAATLDSLLADYGDHRISNEQGRRLYTTFVASTRTWNAGARTAMALAAAGRLDSALTLQRGQIGQWGIQRNRDLDAWAEFVAAGATAASSDALEGIAVTQRELVLFVLLGVVVSGLVGVLVARAITRRLEGLEVAVDAVATGRFQQAVPFTEGRDEIGSLARSVDVLKGSAEAMERQRWVKANAAAVSGALQGAQTLEAFGDHLLSGLAPLLGGGVADLYVSEEGVAPLRRVAGYGLAPGADATLILELGQGLAGQCAVERRAIALTDLPPDYLRVTSGLGAAPPQQVEAWPLLSGQTVLGVVEFASFGALTAGHRALLDELLPVVAMGLEILQRNLRTEGLLTETQAQAEQLEAQTQEMHAQQEELLAQREELATLEERSRLILGSVSDGIMGLDVEGRMTFVNPAVSAMLGFTPEELLGQPVHQVAHHHLADGTAYPREQCPMYLTTHDGTPRVVDDEVLWRKDGSSFPVEYATTPILRDSDLVGTVVVFRDITERVQAQRTMAEQRASLQKILDSMPIGTAFTTRGIFRYANPAFEEAFGLSVGDEATRIYSRPEDRAEILRQVREAGGLRNREMTFVAKGAEHRVFLTTFVPFTYEGDDGLIGFLLDITERRRMEEEVKRVGFMSDSALDLTKAGYWLIDFADEGYYTSSERAARIFGEHPTPGFRYHLADEWLNRIVAADPKAAEAVGAHYADAVAGRVPRYDTTYPYRRPVDGRVVWIRALGNVMRDEQGRATVMYGVTQDVTEIKEAQAEVLRAKEVAEEATKAKSDFLANMSHEIRTPMNAIIGMSHLALQTGLDKKQRNYVEKVHRAAVNLLGIINDILDFSKIEAGKLAMETVEFRLEDVMDNLANLVGMKAEDRGLELLFAASPEVPTALVGDPLRLGQILINLGNNAVKFTETGEIVVGIEPVPDAVVPDGTVELHFWVRDSGIGMTPEQCGKMFQAFSQADASTTRRFGGTGLGLAISKRLVEMMHGRIWVESEYGKGSTFHFHARFGVQAEPMARRAFRADELRGVRALVVDDNASAREILSSMSRNFGLEVDVAAGGSEALALLRHAEDAACPYDVVLMDWKMPGMDGVETVTRMQAAELARTPSVIMVTAFGREEAMHEAGARGAVLTAVLSKPVTPSTLLETIGAALGRGLVAETRSQETAAQADDAMQRLTGTRVLLVEDNEMNQELASELLAQAGMEVVIANHGREALDILARQPSPSAFDGILMDCQMPVMDGYTATREIRKDPAYRDIPIVAMTANAMAGDREKVLEAGMNDHVAKPLDVRKMFATLAHWFVAKQPADGGAAPPAPAANAASGIPPLPGIDTAAGLAVTMGNQKLYRRLLVKFRDSQADFATQFAAASGDADPEAAARAAHTLKGTAGSIGAKALQAAAARLESACTAHDAGQIASSLADTVAALTPVLEALAAVDADGGAAAGGRREIDRAKATELLGRLDALLAANDTKAVEVAEELAGLTGGAPLAPILEKLTAAIGDYDFDVAQGHARAARAALGTA